MLVSPQREMLHPVHFYLLANRISRSAHFGQSHRTSNRSVFVQHFGAPAVVCSDVWRYATLPAGTRPIHILWALLFLKTYLTEIILCSIVGATTKTFRKWIWPVIRAIAALSIYVVRVRHPKPILFVLFLTIFLSSDKASKSLPEGSWAKMQNDG
jgi:hypothetical protein